MSAAHPAALDEKALLAHCEVQRTRRSGPGGQHRNKVESAVVLKHAPTGIIAEAAERRSQHENLRVALRRLRINLAIEHRVDRSDAASPSELWKSRCRNGRISLSERHDDFPTLLAEALDVIDRFGIDLHNAAEFLDCTRTQLVGFLRAEPRAFAAINRRRVAAGQKRLR
ncbi:MAG: peptide chain release factor-like protein [Planctomycetaceae bacterium]